MAASSVLHRVGVRKALLYALGLVPLAALVAGLIGRPPVDPYETIARATGENALRMLILTLAVTPAIALTGWRKLGPYRRTLGVLSFTYALLHVAAYMVFEAEFDPTFLLDDIPERRFIAVGVIAFALMLPLAITSNNLSCRIMCRKWKKMHRLIYPLALLAPLHFLLLKRGEDLTEPLVYMGIAVALLAARVVKWRLARRTAAASNTLSA